MTANKQPLSAATNRQKLKTVGIPQAPPGTPQKPHNEAHTRTLLQISFLYKKKKQQKKQKNNKESVGGEYRSKIKDNENK